jgi:hypothetical protein
MIDVPRWLAWLAMLIGTSLDRQEIAGPNPCSQARR